jgi:hypothetical protein
MRALLVPIVLLAALAGRAQAEDVGLGGLQSDGSKPRGFMGVVIGHMNAETRGDNYDRTPTDYSGWAYGMTFRGELINLRSVYGGRYGMTMDFDALLFSSGAYTRDDEDEAIAGPRLGFFYLGIAPALALGAIKTASTDISMELGMPINTDFYGLSAGIIFRIKSFYLSYKIRSGIGWHGQQVLDERIRIGGGGRLSFVGLDITHGYSEDEMSRANLGSILKGGYTMISLIVSAGK